MYDSDKFFDQFITRLRHLQPMRRSDPDRWLTRSCFYSSDPSAQNSSRLKRGMLQSRSCGGFGFAFSFRFESRGAPDV